MFSYELWYQYYKAFIDISHCGFRQDKVIFKTCISEICLTDINCKMSFTRVWKLKQKRFNFFLRSKTFLITCSLAASASLWPRQPLGRQLSFVMSQSIKEQLTRDETQPARASAIPFLDEQLATHGLPTGTTVEIFAWERSRNLRSCSH